MDSLKIFNNISSYLEVKAGAVTQDKEFVLKMCLGGEEFSGLVCCVLRLAKDSSCSLPEDSQQYCLLYQWLEFVSLHSAQMKSNPQHYKTVLKELNTYLEKFSYLVGYNKSLADAVLYYFLYDSVALLSPQEKESIPHVSRWFDHIQQDEKIRQKNKLLNFSTTYFGNRAAGTH